MDRRPARAFTLVELLVVIGIVALLIAVLLPALSAAQRRARAVECANNVRQLCVALNAYAGDHRGSYPPNAPSPAPGRWWYDADRLGTVLPGLTRSGAARGRAVTCPEDDGAVRSYAMNYWASGIVDPAMLAGAKDRGAFWKQSVARGSRMILVTEKWSSSGSPAVGGHFATAVVGQLGATPGRRFGAGGGLSPLMNAGRFGPVNCELAFQRHRRRGGAGAGTDPLGHVHIGYADGHVDLKSDAQLADAATGLSTLDSLWTPIDEALNK